MNCWNRKYLHNRKTCNILRKMYRVYFSWKVLCVCLFYATLLAVPSHNYKHGDGGDEGEQNIIK